MTQNVYNFYSNVYATADQCILNMPYYGNTFQKVLCVKPQVKIHYNLHTNHTCKCRITIDIDI